MGRHFTFGHRGLHIIMSFTQLLFCLILGLVGIVVAYQADESGYYSYWKPETYADYEPQEKQSFATKTNPLANIFNRIQSRQSVGGIGAIVAAGIAVAGVVAIAANAAQANTNRLNDEDAKLRPLIDSLSTRVGNVETTANGAATSSDVALIKKRTDQACSNQAALEAAFNAITINNPGNNDITMDVKDAL